MIKEKHISELRAKYSLVVIAYLGLFEEKHSIVFSHWDDEDFWDTAVFWLENQAQAYIPFQSIKFDIDNVADKDFFWTWMASVINSPHTHVPYSEYYRLEDDRNE